MKTLLVTAVLAAAVAGQPTRRVFPCNLILDQWQPGSSLVYSGDVKEPAIPESYTRSEFYFPEGGVTSDVIITRLEVTDNDPDGTGSCPFIVSGGVGSKRVHIKFISGYDREIDHHVTIHAVPLEK